MKHMRSGEDPYDGAPITGDDPGIDAKTFQSTMLDKLGTIRELGHRLLPGDHGLSIRFGRNQPEVPLDGIEIEEDESGYRTKIVEGVGELKKEIAVGALTVVGLMTAIELIRVYRKTKK
jgi:hypothetical protein